MTATRPVLRWHGGMSSNRDDLRNPENGRATEPAVLRAAYSDFKFIKTRKSLSLSFEVPLEHQQLVHDVLGMPNPEAEKWVAIAVLSPDAVADTDIAKPISEKPKETKGPHSDYAQALYKCRFMRNLNVCQALGTEADYKAWIQKQDSCVSGKQDYIGMESGEMCCEESHVERVSEGHGKGIKAPYHSVPLTHAEHQLRHQKGEIEVIGIPGLRLKYVKDWFDKKALEYREKWVHERLCAVTGVKSLTEIDPEKLRKWCESKGVEEALPSGGVLANN